MCVITIRGLRFSISSGGALTFDTGQKRFTLHAGESVLLTRSPRPAINESNEESVSLVITVRSTIRSNERCASSR